MVNLGFGLNAAPMVLKTGEKANGEKTNPASPDGHFDKLAERTRRNMLCTGALRY